MYERSNRAARQVLHSLGRLVVNELLHALPQVTHKIISQLNAIVRDTYLSSLQVGS